MSTSTPKSEVKKPNYIKLTIKFIKNDEPKNITDLQTIVTEEEVENPVHIYYVEKNTESNAETYTIVYDNNDEYARGSAIIDIFNKLVSSMNRIVLSEYGKVLVKILNAYKEIDIRSMSELFFSGMETLLDERLIHVSSDNPNINEGFLELKKIVKSEIERDKHYNRLDKIIPNILG